MPARSLRPRAPRRAAAPARGLTQGGALLVALVIGTLGCAPTQGQDKQVLGYYPHWIRASYPHTEIPFEALTHISHAFVWPGADGSLQVPPDLAYPELIDAAHAHGVPVVLAVGGWDQSDGFGPMTADPVRRGRFVEALVAFCREHGYDGVDLDWEYPTFAHRTDLVRLAAELRAALTAAAPGLTLSITLPAFDQHAGFDVGALVAYTDWLSVMTYDYHGPWHAHAGHNAPLFRSGDDDEGTVSASVLHWLGKGVPPEQLNIGLAFYGRLFDAAGLYAPSGGGSDVSYADVLERLNGGWTRHWDAVANVPYLQDPALSQLISYDDSTSIRMKAGFLRANALRGAVIWTLGLDRTETGDQHLLRTAGRYLITSPPRELPRSSRTGARQ